MRNWGFGLAASLTLFALAPMSVAASDGASPPREMMVSIDVAIAADGSVEDYRLDSDLEQSLRGRMQKEVSSWRFDPVMKDGHATRAKTRLLLTLEPAEGYDHWRISEVSLGQPALARRALLMPDYPQAAYNAHLSAEVVLVVRIDARGKVAAVHAEQTNLTLPGDAGLAAQWREIFEGPCIRAAKGWKFHPPESVDGQAVESTVRIALVFVYYGDRAHRFYPGPVTPAPWLAGRTDDPARREQLTEGQIQPLDSRFRLHEEVVGRVL